MIQIKKRQISNSAYRILTLLVLFAFSSVAQNRFEKAFGGNGKNSAYGAKQTIDKGFIVVGFVKDTSTLGNDIYLVKKDSIGNTQWNKVYGGPNDDEGYAVELTKDGGYILCGYTNSFGAGAFDACIIKINAIGDTLWTKTYGGTRNDYGNAIKQTNDGGYIIAGSTQSFLTGIDSGNVYLIKTDSLGNVKWTKSFGSNLTTGSYNTTDAYSISETSDKGFIICGYTNAFGEPVGDAFLAKTDSVGNIVFTKTYGGKGVDWANSVIITNDGGYMITGAISTDSTSANQDVYLIKTNALGDTLFTASFGGNGEDLGQDIMQTLYGDYLITGYTGSFGAGGNDAFLIKTNTLGDTIFTKLYGGASNDQINGIYPYTDGTIGMVGMTDSYVATTIAMFLIKADSNGNSGCNQYPFNGMRRHFFSNTTTATTLLTYGNTITTIVGKAHTGINSFGQDYTICGTAGILPVGLSESLIKIYPNPNNGAFTIEPNNYITQTMHLYNVNGKLVLSQTINSKTDIYASNLSDGVYNISLISNEGVVNKRLVIVK